MGPSDNSGDPKKAKAGVKYSPFTVDAAESGVQEMPTISSLLNRKKTQIQKVASRGSKSFSQPIAAPKKNSDPASSIFESGDVPALETLTERPVERPATQAAPSKNSRPDEISLKFETHEPAIERAQVEVAAVVAIQPGKRTKKTNTQRTQNLLVWSEEELSQSPDPLAKFIHKILASGARQGLFLSIDIPEGSSVPEFAATAYFGAPDLVSVWTGLRWNPRITPELWRGLIKDGIMEFSPPGPETVATSERNVTRNALGAAGDSYLLVMRVGPAKSCRGLLAVLSSQSLSEIAKANQTQVFASLQPQTNTNTPAKAA